MLPTGTVTFLLTDVAGSTAMWETEGTDAMHAAVARHYEILGDIVAAHGGVRPEEQGEGDSIVAAFTRPSDAVSAAVDAQIALLRERWPTSVPLVVRMAVHTGEAHLRDAANYAGQAIIRTARLRSLGHGGQILVSGVTRDLIVDEVRSRFDLRSLGEHPLRGLGRVEQVWQVSHPALPAEFDQLVTANTGPPRSLPRPLTPFVGRQSELDDLAALVADERLVVVTGAGGAGKTRIAIHLASERKLPFADRVHWVELAPVDDAGVEPAVRAAFGISQSSTHSTEESVRRTIGGQPTLLILDNCEHVTEAVADLAARLAAASPDLHVLATSRVSLGVPGEIPWRVPPLATPDPLAATDDLVAYDAVRLFCDRARRARPSFTLNDDNAAAIAGICHSLGGIPLAIELAAARSRILGPQQILDGLSDSIGVLSGGASVSPRQQTLDASIAWSVDLLSDGDRRLLERLSVFVDGWTLEAAQAVTADELLDRPAIFDGLDRLVDHSLVTAGDLGDATRFSMLETVRQFAHRQLEATGAGDGVRSRHAAYFAGWLDAMGLDLQRAELEQRFDRLVAERSNLLAAHARLVATGDLDAATGLLSGLFPVASLSEWVPVIDAMVDRTERYADQLPVERLAGFRWGQAIRAGGRGDVPAMVEHMRHAEEAASAAGNQELRARSSVMQLIMAAAGGADVLDALVAAWDGAGAIGSADLLGWVGACAEHAAALQHGPIATAEVARRIDQEAADLAPSIALLRCTNRALVDYAIGDARAAVEASAVPAASRFTNTLSRPTAILTRSLASLELGRPVPEAVDVLRRRSHVEGSRLDEYALRVIETAQALGADDIEGAASSFSRAIELGGGLGMATFAADLASLVVAAGGDVPDRGADRPGVPLLVTAEERCSAELALQSGSPAVAVRHAHVALAIERANGMWRVAAITLDVLGRALIALGRPIDGLRLIGATNAFRADHGLIAVPALQRLAAAARSAAEADLGAGAAAEAFEQGSELTIEAAIDLAGRQRVARNEDTVGWDALTPTESKVAELVATGMTNTQVAAELVMGAETVKTHLSRVFGKVGVRNRKELILAAARRSGPTR